MPIHIYEKRISVISSHVPKTPKVTTYQGKTYRLYFDDSQKVSHLTSAFKAIGRSLLAVATLGGLLFNRLFRENLFSDWAAIFTGQKTVYRYVEQAEGPEKGTVQKIQNSVKSIATQTKKAETSTVVSPRGGFGNIWGTSYLGIALQYIDTLFLSLPKFPKSSDLRQKEEESLVQFIKRKKAAEEVLKLFQKINNGEDCSGHEVADLKKYLYEADPMTIGNPDPKVMMDSFMVSDSLLNMFYPVLNPNNWHKFGSFTIGCPYKFNSPDLGKSMLLNASFKRLFKTEVVSEGSKEVKIQFSELKDPFPSFLSFHVGRLDPRYKMQLPFNLEFSDKAQKIPAAQYELAGVSTTGKNHHFFGKENGKWIRYNSEKASKEVLEDREVEELLSLNNASMIQYRKLQ